MHGVQRVEPQSTYMILQYFSGHGYAVHGVQCGESQSTHLILEFFSEVFRSIPGLNEWNLNQPNGSWNSSVTTVEPCMVCNAWNLNQLI